MKTLFYNSLVCVLNGMLAFDRHVVKRYLNIETPLYKAWWKAHSAQMQYDLDREAFERKGYEEGWLV